MIDTEKYMSRQYGSPPCWELVADFYREDMGLPIDRYAVISGSLREAARLFSLHLVSDAHGFVRLEGSAPGCIVLMGASARTGIHHAGIYADDHSILHALPSGVFLESEHALADRYELMEFWGREHG